MRPLRPVSKKLKKISLPSLLLFQALYVVDFAPQAIIHLMQQFADFFDFLATILLFLSGDPVYTKIGSPDYTRFLGNMPEMDAGE
ncbi:hypothetical protein AAGT82_19215 [Enterobacter quasihormaechei]|uniref:Uncharacterized protein n=1 Tax=Enterobacter quasihormaechei TaxID=2529382 RepID=A0ABU9PNB0_9ENTR